MSRKLIPSKDMVTRVVTFSILFLAGIIVMDAPQAVSRPAEPTSDAALLEGYRHVEVASVSDAMEKITGQRMPCACSMTRWVKAELV